ncbi:retrovirus-related pol polyprotein from transposon TNT 1-94 [Tanacetum coccineum]|uniref:Retrovirus-related pol polyprotein from transposon TNT 1-94 n=1 Tax=Tanacetum coccineum TaxID=301880 RepID=A0ABQ4XW32_9ASTR
MDRIQKHGKNELVGFKKLKKREFSVARTPQQNGVAERKNRTLIEAVRTMLADSLLLTVFRAEAVNTACYVLNRVLVTKPHNKTPYELIIGRPPSISFMRPFGCPVTILNTLDPLGTFDGKAEEGFLVGNLHVNFLENKPNVAGHGPNWIFDIDSLTNSMNYQPVTAGNQTNKNASPQEANGNTGLKQSADIGQSEEKNVSTQQYIMFLLWSSISSSYKSSDENDIAYDSAGESPMNAAIATRTIMMRIIICSSWVDPLQMIHLMHDLEDTTEVEAMQESVHHFQIQKVWTLVDLPYGKKAIGTNQPPGFVDPEFPEKVYKVEKALYGLHQAPRAWVPVLDRRIHNREVVNFLGSSALDLKSDVRLWIQFMQTKIHVDNESTISVVKNPAYHSKTKHIEIRHHFIRDSYEKKLIGMDKSTTEQ